MTTINDLDRELATWLGEGGATVLRREVLATALADARRSPQHRWPVLPSLGNRSWSVVRLGMAAVLAISVATGALLLRTGRAGPVPAADPFAGFFTEQVEPGVFRIANDGVRDLAWSADGYDQLLGEIVVGLDGSVWDFGMLGTWSDCAADPPCAGDRMREFRRLGAAPIHRLPETVGRVSDQFAMFPDTIEVAPDGTIWAVVSHDGDPASIGDLLSYDGTSWTARWTAHELGRASQVEVGDDGTVWTAWLSESDRTTGIAMLPPGAREWVIGPSQPAEVAEYPIIASPSGRFILRDGFDRVERLRAGNPGVIVEPFATMPPMRDGAAEDGTVRVPWSAPAKVGDDGTLWLRLEGTQGGFARMRHDPGDIASAGGHAWETFDMGDLGRQGHLHPVGVGPDGSGWLASPIDNGPQGLVRLGDAPRRYLDGEVIASVDLAADGTVWVQAATGYAGGRIEVYAILPETASAVAEALRTLLGAAGS